MVSTKTSTTEELDREDQTVGLQNSIQTEEDVHNGVRQRTRDTATEKKATRQHRDKQAMPRSKRVHSVEVDRS